MFKDGQARQAGWYLVQDGEDALSAGRKRLRPSVKGLFGPEGYFM